MPEEEIGEIIMRSRQFYDVHYTEATYYVDNFERSAFEIEKENRSLKYEIELKDNEIGSLKKRTLY